jgi:cation diffusion facilitator family transporter
MLTSQDKALIRISTYASLSVAFVVLMIKAYGWFVTESQAMLASFVDSMLDISSSLINVVAIRFALEPPDNNHRFGHEKFQDLAVFSQGMFFLASSLFTLFSSLRVLLMYHEINNPEYGLNAMYICVGLTMGLVTFQTYVFNRTGSLVVSADKLHYFSDLLANIAVIISIKLSGEYWFLDPLFGIVISLYIIHGSYRLFLISIRNLVDEEFTSEDRQKILQVIKNHEQITGVHDLKTRRASNKVFIQFHLEMDGDMSLYQAHQLSEKIMYDLLNIFPEADIIIHQDPDGISELVEHREKV